MDFFVNQELNLGSAVGQCEAYVLKLLFKPFDPLKIVMFQVFSINVVQQYKKSLLFWQVSFKTTLQARTLVVDSIV